MSTYGAVRLYERDDQGRFRGPGDTDAGHRAPLVSRPSKPDAGEERRSTFGRCAVFTGQRHQGATGTLERRDLTAAFGAERSE